MGSFGEEEVEENEEDSGQILSGNKKVERFASTSRGKLQSAAAAKGTKRTDHYDGRRNRSLSALAHSTSSPRHQGRIRIRGD